MYFLRNIITSSALLLILNLVPSTTQALVPSTDLNDSRSIGSGVSNHGLTIGNYQITWAVTGNANGSYHYDYNVTNILGLSLLQGNFFLQLGSGTSLSSLTNFSVNGNLISTLLGYSVADATIGSDNGIQVSVLTSLPFNEISFDAFAAPSWGDFRQTSISSLLGTLGYVDNTGFGSTPTSPFGNWITVPGDAFVVAAPEPTTMLALGTSMLIAALAKRRKMEGKSEV